MNSIHYKTASSEIVFTALQVDKKSDSDGDITEITERMM